MKTEYFKDGLILSPETELEKIYMNEFVDELRKDMCHIDKDGNIKIRFKMKYEQERSD